LVDRIGTMQDAIAYVAGEAKLTDYEVRIVPEPKNFLEQIIEEAMGGKDESPHRLGITAGGDGASLVDLALPYLRGLDPVRVRAITDALRQLQMFQRESVLMLMPGQMVWR